MMKFSFYIIFIIFVTGLRAGENSEPVNFEPNLTKHNLITSSYQSTDSLVSEEREEKSVMKAALFSAVIPGTGQLYAGSTWKAILFGGIEIAAWTAYIVYTGKANDQESQMEDYANSNWSEQKYWSRLYYDAYYVHGLDVPERDYNETTNLLTDYGEKGVEDLRYLEDALGHSHRLPETKTQQYYEMIYKYLTQFGNGWADADFYYHYYGNTNDMTAQMFTYRDMRNDMNSYYDAASTVTNIILVNHVLSALDAAWTARSYNREINIKLHAYNKRYLDENVQMYGVNVTW